MATAKPLAAKLFLECKEVPFIGATVTHTVGQAAISYIDLVPHQTINNIKPRTLAQLFIRDFNNPDGNYPWIKMFEGEVFGYQFSKNPSGRSFSVSCIDYSSYWDNALLYFFNPQQSMGKGSESISSSGFEIKDAKKSGIDVKAVTHSVSSFFLKILRENSTSPNDFLSGLIAVFKNLTNINDFYKLADDRLRISDRILLKSSGELQKLLETAEAEEWLNKIIGSSSYSSVRMVIQDLMSLIFHDFVTVPFPARVDTQGALTKEAIKRGSEQNKTVGDFIFKPNLYMLPPPSCNIFFPDEYSNFSFSRNFLQEPTRLIYKPEMPTFFGNTPIQMPHAYEPDSFNDFMLNKDGITSTGTGDLDVSEFFGKYADKDGNTATNTANQGSKREWNFLTNEEKLKGILMSQEGMVPGVTQFRSSLTDVGRKELSESIAQYLFFKKRFEGRSLQITSHLKPSVVPGFPVLVLDDSEAEQSMIAYCSSVTHRIYSNQGGYTNTTLSYARTVDEQDSTSESANEPLIPPWFSELIFGKNVKVKINGDSVVNKVEVDEARGGGIQSSISQFYASLIGNSGSKVVTDLKNKNTLLEATSALLKDYRTFRAKGQSEVQTFIARITGRDYVTMRETFKFLGASTSRKDLNTSFVEFFGDRISGAGESPPRDSEQIKLKRAIITKYRDILKSRRGFRG